MIQFRTELYTNVYYTLVLSPQGMLNKWKKSTYFINPWHILSIQILVAAMVPLVLEVVQW